jgi:ABC-type polysaccharide/polyol phosphate transport system ATPase subunit
MQTNLAIEVKNVTKIFPQKPQFMRKHEDTFISLVSKRLIKKNDKDSKFYALRNVSFTVSQGESVGIIGSNGAGKSTLLRVLTGIIHPTEGEVKIHGKHGELFALNAGFNLNLSGRKNIYLLGAIKGFSEKEIAKLENHIIEFSQLGHFIDQPVKVYSSGMRGRLGFSIIIHLLPNIIFIDEALATGDQNFRKKSQERLEDLVNSQSKTLVIVSHSSNILRELCSRLIWLEKGEIIMDGETEEVISSYENT